MCNVHALELGRYRQPHVRMDIDVDTPSCGMRTVSASPVASPSNTGSYETSQSPPQRVGAAAAGARGGAGGRAQENDMEQEPQATMPPDADGDDEMTDTLASELSQSLHV